MRSTKTTPKVRVRFPPSPTGFLHIGSLRTALYNYLFARKHGGVFILRIEDTDRMRTVPGGIENIVKTLSWMGLIPDEGVGAQRNFQFPISNFQNVDVDIGETGKYGPYVQSARLEIYKKYAEKLLETGSAYICTCSPERLDKVREEQMARKEMPRYDRLCRNQAVGSKLSAVSAHVIRLKVPEQGSTKFKDIIRGEVEFENKLIDDQVLMKSDGYPTYHLANVVDDHLMKVTHVIRGEEWLSSTPKHVLLYKAFKWKPPQFAHLPLLLNADHSKLSKRQGDVAVEDYIKKGYLREALLNFVATLGFNPRADKELYTLDELIAEFDLTKVNKSGAVVNFEKLDWMNGNYLRRLSPEQLTQRCITYWVGAGLLAEFPISNFQFPNKYQITNSKEIVNLPWLARVAALEQERLKTLSGVVEATEYFFLNQPLYEPGILVWKKAPKESVAPTLSALKDAIEKYSGAWEAAGLEVAIKSWIEKEGRGVGEILWPFRVALSGRAASPPPFAIAEILGKPRTLARLEYAIKLAKQL